MKSEGSQIISRERTETKCQPITYNRHVYKDTDRQLFNVSLSVYQFLKEARKDEARGVQARRRCRNLLESGKILEARIAARKALEAKGRAFACSAVSKRMKWLLNKLSEEDNMKPELESALKLLDSAVLANDIWEAKRIINSILTEIENVDAPEIPENPTEKEITQYLKQLKEEIAILNRLKTDNGSGGDLSTLCYYELGGSSESSSIVSSASRLSTEEVEPKRVSRFRVIERSAYE